MSVRLTTITMVAVAILLAGGLACRKPAASARPEQPSAGVAPEPAKSVVQAQKNDDEEQKRKAEAEAEAARKAAAMQEADYRNAAEAALKNVHFDFDESTIMENDKPVLNGISEFLKHYPLARLTIDGDCDERGTVEYNLALGERRAYVAMEYLVGLGVSASRLTTLSYGKEKPICTESIESCWSQNRRAHFVLK